MYVFGGAGIHGFSFALLVGVLVGTYSSIGIATPLLYRPRVLHTVVYVLIALGLFGGLSVTIGDFGSRATLLAVAALVIGGALIWAINLELRTPRRAAVLAGGGA